MSEIIAVRDNNPFIKIRFNNFNYNEEDKKIIEKIKNTNGSFNPETKEWNVSLAYITSLGEEIISKIKTAQLSNIPILIPNSIERHDYQVTGAQFLLKNNLAILGDAFGIGKTIQALIATRSELLVDPNKTILIVVPLSLIEKWRKEINRVFENEPNLIDNIIITNYEKFRSKEVKTLLSKSYSTAIFDEASKLRNATKFRRGIKKLHAEKVWLLTGEMIEKNPLDAFKIINTFYPYFNKFSFDNDFVIKKKLRFGEKSFMSIVGFRNLEKLKNQLSQIYLRRTKADIHDIKDIEIINEDRMVDLTESQKKKIQELTNNATDEEKLKLFQEIRLLLNDANYKDPNLKIDSNKFEELLDIINETGDEKIIVFTSYRYTLDKLYKTLLNEKPAIQTICINSDMNAKERNDQLEKFKKTDSIKVLISTDILAYGQDITESGILVNYDLPLLAGVLNQRLGRIDRMIQERNKINNITIYTNTEFDKKIKKILIKKTSYQIALTGETSTNSFSEEELRDVIKKIL